MHIKILDIANLKRIRIAAYALSFLSFLYLLSFLVLPNLSSEGVQATAGVESVPTLSVSPSSMVAFNVDPGTFNSASSTVSVSTNNYTGYTLTLSADTTDLVHNVNSNLTIPTLTLPEGEDYVASSAITNAYGYSLNTTDYYPITTTASGGSELATTSTANSTANEYTLTFGAHVAPTTPAGTYTNTITITAVSNPTGYTITYDANAGNDTVTNMPTPNPQQSTISGLSINLSNATPTRTGYTFLGWDEDSTATTPTYEAGDTFILDPETGNSKTFYAVWEVALYTVVYNGNGADAGVMTNVTHTNVQNNDAFDLFASNFSKSSYGFVGWSTNPDAEPGDGVSTIYGPNETITITSDVTSVSDANNIITLYAIWVPVAKDSNNADLTFQTANLLTTTLSDNSTLNSKPDGYVTALKDARDNQVYAVAKLADGNYWMIENLRLEAAGTVGNNINDSSVTNESLSQGYGGAFVGLDTAETTTFATSTPNNLYNSTNITSNLLNRIPRHNNINKISRDTNPTVTDDRSAATSSHGPDLNTQIYSYGSYYTWAAAMANTDEITTKTASDSVNTSICPSGWHLPTGGAAMSGEISMLDIILGGTGDTDDTETASSRWRKYPNNYMYSGFQNSTIVNSGRGGGYWTSSVIDDDSNNVFGFDIYNKLHRPGTRQYAKYLGRSVRCVADITNPALYTIVYNGNGSDTGTMTSVEHTDIKRNDGFALYASNFSKAGYGFAGWSTNPNAEPGDGVSRIYGPNEYMIVTGDVISASDVNNIITLYAVWVAPETDGNNGPLYFQDFDQTANPYASAPNGTVIALTDKRDNQVYAVAKLADGNYWMIENLRLNPADSNTTITAANTNNPTSTFINTDLANIATPYFKTCEDNNSACDDQLSFGLGNVTGSNDAPDNGDQTTRWYSYGVMYNWYTATAGNGTYSIASGTTNGDICPAGWHVPYGGDGTGAKGGNTSGGFYYLGSRLNANSSDATSSSIWRSYPNNFIYSGNHDGSSALYRGSFGVYWSATAHTSNNAYNFNFSGNSVHSGDYSLYKYLGRAVRCLIDGPVYSIVYNGNNADAGVMTNVSHTNVKDNDTFDLFASNYSKAGYGFAGWSTNPNAEPGDGVSTIYGPNEAITINSDITSARDVNNVITLYAVWVPVAKDSNNTDLTFQTQDLLTTTLSDNSTLDSKTNGYVTALKDARDNQVYAVAKLADGNFWMIENLRLEAAGTVGNNINNSSITNESLSQGYGGAFVGLANPETTDFTGTGNANSLYSSTNITGSNLAFRMPRYNNTNTSSRSSNPTINDDRSLATSFHNVDLNDAIYSYGNYYNWAAAIADTNDYENYADHPTTNTSICPSGWHLPSGYNETGEFGLLDIALGGDGSVQTSLEAKNNWKKYPNNYIYNGYYLNSNALIRGNFGYYWSSSSNGIQESIERAYNLGFSNAYIYPGNYETGNKFNGGAVRCLIASTSVPVNNNNSPSSPSNSPEPAQQQSSNPEPTQTSSEPAQTSNEPQVQQTMSSPKSTSTRSVNLANTESTPSEPEEEEDEEGIDSEEGNITPLGVRRNYGSDDYVSDGTYDSNSTASESSTFATIAAAGLVTTGITLVIVGGKKKKDEEEEDIF